MRVPRMSRDDVPPSALAGGQQNSFAGCECLC